MEAFLAGSFVHEAFESLHGWCKKHTGDNLFCEPLHSELETVQSTYADLFKSREPFGDPLPLNIDSPKPVPDDAPDEDLILHLLHVMH